MQETELVGRIATALLLEGESGTEGLLYAPTLRRISRDLDRERRAASGCRQRVVPPRTARKSAGLRVTRAGAPSRVAKKRREQR